MWAVIKIDTKKVLTLKQELLSILGNEVKFYAPKLKIIKYFKSKTYIKDTYLLGDYLLCFHKDFNKQDIITSLKYCKGLKYFLNNFKISQVEIEKFVSKCKQNEDKDGYIKQTFFDFINRKKYEFISGPFTNFIFSILNENKFLVTALIGKHKISVSKEENLFRPV